MKSSYIEQVFEAILVQEGLPKPVREMRLVDGRRWRSDFVWIRASPLMAGCFEIKGFVLEIEGGIWSKGRHARPDGITKDIEKYNEFLLNGFLVLRATTEQVESGYALDCVKRMLKFLDIVE